MHRLKQYWHEAITRLRKPSPSQPPYPPRADEFERDVAAITREKRALSSELDRVRAALAEASQVENRKIAALAQADEHLEAARDRDREKLAALERLGSELDKARTEEAQRLARLERRIDDLEAERDQSREEIRRLEVALTTTTNQLEKTTHQLSDLHAQAMDQAKDFQAALSQTADRLDDTEEYVRSMEKKLENDHRHYANALQELQLDQRRQNQRVSWAITVAGLALLLGTVAGGLLIWDVQKNAGILTAMSSDMNTLMSSINQHQSLRHGQAEQQPDLALAFANDTLREPAAVDPNVDQPTPVETAPPLTATPTTGRPVPVSHFPISAFKRLRKEKRQDTPGTNGGEASAFLEAHAAEAVQLPSGLQYRIIKAGSGKAPTMADQVVVDYLGATPDGLVFANTYSTSQAATYRMSEVTHGWQQALLHVREGAELELYLPPQLAQEGSLGEHITGYAPSLYLIELLQVIEGDEER